MDLFKLKHVCVKSRVTKIDRHHTDKLIKLADELNKDAYQRMANSINGNDDFAVDAFQDYYIEAPQTAFCLYCLAIMHCYVMLENNRNQILGKKLSKIKELNKFLLSYSIDNAKVKCFKTTEEFRLVNNELKHERLSTSKTIKDTNGKIYGLKQLKYLYEHKSKYLETYLTDLYRLSLKEGLRTE